MILSLQSLIIMFLRISKAKILYGGQVKLEKFTRTDILHLDRKEIVYSFNTKIILLVGKWREPSLFSADSGVLKKRNLVTFKEVRTSVWNVLKFYKKYRIVEATMVFEQSIVPRRVFKVPMRIYYNNISILTYKLSLVDLKKSGYEDIVNAKPLIQIKIDRYSGKAMNQTYEKEYKVVNSPTLASLAHREAVDSRINISDHPAIGITTESYLSPSQSFKAITCEAPVYEDLDLESEELSSTLPETLVQIEEIDKTLTNINKEVKEKKLEKLAEAAAVTDLYEPYRVNPLRESALINTGYITAKDRFLVDDPILHPRERSIIPLGSSGLKNGDILDRMAKIRKLPVSSVIAPKTLIRSGPLDRKNYFKRLFKLK